jgi:hypothetical protein
MVVGATLTSNISVYHRASLSSLMAVNKKGSLITAKLNSHYQQLRRQHSTFEFLKMMFMEIFENSVFKVFQKTSFQNSQIKFTIPLQSPRQHGTSGGNLA